MPLTSPPSRPVSPRSSGPPLDVIVLGLGGMGSAAAWQLARMGLRVLGLEQHGPAHDRGSSHGRTRVIRQAYFEHPSYVPLLQRAYALWHETEQISGRQLLTICGGLMMGPADSEVVCGSLRSAQAHGLAHELLDAAEVRRRYPPIHLPDGQLALHESCAGVVHTERAVQTHLDLATIEGADLRFQEPVIEWSIHGDGVRVRTVQSEYAAARLVITPGPWAPRLLAGLGVPLQVERQVLYWFQPRNGVRPFLPDRFPIYIWDLPGECQPYGFPALDGPAGGVKAALFRAPEVKACTPENVDRLICASDEAAIRPSLRELIPDLDGPLVHAVTCLYTNTPDKHFLIGLHPEHGARVVFAAGFSGHGFKFCSVVGEILAELAETGRSRHDLSLFSPGRFSAGRSVR